MVLNKFVKLQLKSNYSLLPYLEVFPLLQILVLDPQNMALQVHSVSALAQVFVLMVVFSADFLFS